MLPLNSYAVRRPGQHPCHMNLWQTRAFALAALDTELKAEAALLDRGFQLLEFLCEKLYAVDPQTPFTRICALTAVKIRNLLHACYSLDLDGHAQEAGSIARVLVESIELLVYFDADPQRVHEAIDDRLPTAGARPRRLPAGFNSFGNTGTNTPRISL